MYTWGYIKDASLSKLDLNESEANRQQFLSRFPFYANEVITQITSSIKPKYSFYNIFVEDKQFAWEEITKKYNLYTNIKTPISPPSKYSTENERQFWEEWSLKHFCGEEIIMPSDFVSFGDDVCTITVKTKVTYYDYEYVTREAYDTDFSYKGYNKIICYKEGTYSISYNATWYIFTKNIDDSEEINVPNDILDCIPSYVASQCWKIDDEYKSSVFRNEYETFLARIDNTNFKNTKTLSIKGDW